MIKDLFLQKGWAGRTITRAETVERLNPLVKLHHELNMSYYALQRDTANAAVRQGVEAQMKISRADLGKLKETVFSNGGIAYNGTELELENFNVGDSDAERVNALTELEGDFRKAIAAESEIEHHMRTRAILGVVDENAERRLKFLRDAARL